MKCYNVNGIEFSFVYQFAPYYINNIEKFEINRCSVVHHIETRLVQEITVPKGTNIVMGSRRIYLSDTHERIVVFQDNIPIIKIDKALDYSTISLYLRSDIKSIEETEYVYHGIIFMELCLYHSIQSLHGSALNVNGKAVIFSAPSGTGKSTHVEYWKLIDQSFEIINDDKPLIDLQDGVLFASGSPWAGKSKYNINLSVPIHSIVFLEQGTKNTVSLLNGSEKIIYIMRNINRPRQDYLWDKVQDVLEHLVKDIPMYKASITNSIEAALTVKDKIGV